MEDIEQVIEEEGHNIALVMLGNTNYYTGQYFDMKRITQLAHEKGCRWALIVPMVQAMYPWNYTRPEPILPFGVPINTSIQGRAA